jgi:endonuclease/exonuclease/phosphatase family metal-dependent hydrolase
MRILCWNTCRGELGWNRVAGVVNEIQPDVAGLVEAGGTGDDRRAFWNAACPGYHVSMLGGGIVCLTKELPSDGIAVNLPGHGEYRQLDVTARGQTMTLLIVDLQSNPLHSREAKLERLAVDANALSGRPVVIVGDFNTPADSVHFDDLRQRHRQAFDESGAGYMATWPIPLPVLCLDHVWVNDRVRVDHCTHRWTSVSDHRPVVVEVRVVR